MLLVSITSSPHLQPPVLDKVERMDGRPSKAGSRVVAAVSVVPVEKQGSLIQTIPFNLVCVVVEVCHIHASPFPRNAYAMA